MNAEYFKTIADQSLAGVEAGEELWDKICRKAAEEQTASQTRQSLLKKWWIPAAAVLGAAAAVVFLSLRGGLSVSQSSLTQSLTAGGGSGEVASQQVTGVTLTAGSTSDPLFAAEGEEGLILLEGRAYRLAETLTECPVLGQTLGEITEFTRKPSLSDGQSVSSLLPVGTVVSAPLNLEGAGVLAQTEEGWAFFQRVSYGGWALQSGETLRDTLCSPEQVTFLTWQDRTWQGQEARELVALLLECAEYGDSSCGGTSSLLIGLDNGLTLRLYTGNGWISGCGRWWCSEFFEQLEQGY